MSTCKVYGYIINGSEEPIEGLIIQFIPSSLPSVNASTGKAIYPEVLSYATTSTGYFEKYLTINTDFIVIINSLGIKEKIRIPDLSEVSLFSLTSTYVSGDATPTDAGTEKNW